MAVSSSCDVSLPAPVHTSSVKPQVNQVSDSGPSLGGFKSILDDFRQSISSDLASFSTRLSVNKGNNKITELRTVLQRESQNS